MLTLNMHSDLFIKGATSTLVILGACNTQLNPLICDFIELTRLIKRLDVYYNKEGNYLRIKIIILAIESNYFYFIIREINNKYFV